jgi:hypothetical protein
VCDLKSGAIEMKDEDALPTSTTSIIKKENTIDSGLFGKGRYKFWALASILLLAFWSMFTGTVSLRWSGNLNSLTTDIDTPIHDDLDVLVSISFFLFSLVSAYLVDFLCFLFFMLIFMFRKWRRGRKW